MGRKRKRSTSKCIFIGFVSGMLACCVLIGVLFYTKYGFGTFMTLNQIRALAEASALIKNASTENQDDSDTVDYALKGLAASMNDDYACYFTKEELEQYNKSSNGIVEGGIGCDIIKIDNKVYISYVAVGLSAEEAGIKAGDVIVAVDGEKTEGKSTSEVSARVKGEKGTFVKITVDRNGKELAFNVERKDGTRQLTEYKMLKNTGVLYVKIHSFQGNAAEYFKKAIEYGESNSFESILIDLRNNPGGDVEVLKQIEDLILPAGETFYALNKKNQKIQRIITDSEYIAKPIAVLINGESASASEALTGALRELVSAKIVGTKSFGKGVMQTTVILSNGGAFKLTTGKYYLPGGKCIHNEGIEPDYTVEISDELTEKYWLLDSENDLQLQKAISVLTEH